MSSHVFLHVGESYHPGSAAKGAMFRLPAARLTSRRRGCRGDSFPHLARNRMYTLGVRQATNVIRVRLAGVAVKGAVSRSGA